MKLISIFDTYFELPDGFNGTYSDALRLMADYIESDTPDLNEKCKQEIGLDPWRAFNEVLDEKGKLSGTFGLKYWNGDSWEGINKAKINE